MTSNGNVQTSPMEPEQRIPLRILRQGETFAGDSFLVPSVPDPSPIQLSDPSLTAPIIDLNLAEIPDELLPLLLQQTSPKKETLVVAILSAPQNRDIRDIYRTGMPKVDGIRVVFLVDPEAPGAPSPQLLFAEHKMSRDLVFMSHSEIDSMSSTQLLNYIADNTPFQADYVLTSRDDLLLFVDHIYEHLSSILDSSTAKPTYQDVWNDVCLFQMSHNGTTLGKTVCSFGGGNKIPSTLFEWIGGRCEKDGAGVYYLRNQAPVEVLRKFGHKVYTDYKRSRSFCREDWEEIAGHNKVWVEMLQAWKDFAARHNLKWFLISGALIGAARHQGFVPYDPDLDIALAPESYLDTIRYILEEEPDLPLFLARKNHRLLRVVDEEQGHFRAWIPDDLRDIASYFRKECQVGCTTGGTLPAKIRHKNSCYVGAWSGGYVMDVFLVTPDEWPERLGECVVEGLSVPCPADVERWLTKEIGSDWMIPQDSAEKVEILARSNPYMSCDLMEALQLL